MSDTLEQKVAELVDAQAKAVTDYQKMMDAKVQQYEALITKAQHDLAALISGAQPAPPPPPKPEAEWTETENGEKYLVMNVAAAEFFSQIFEQVGALASELGKMAK